MEGREGGKEGGGKRRNREEKGASLAAVPPPTLPPLLPDPADGAILVFLLQVYSCCSSCSIRLEFNYEVHLPRYLIREVHLWLTYTSPDQQ